MKKILALLLALIMCVGVFAACGEDKKEPDTKEPAADDPADKPEDKPSEPTDKPEDPATPDETDKDPVPEGYKRVKATLDMTDIYTLVLQSGEVTYEDRVGVRAPEGKISCGVYNPVGRRTKNYEFDWASLGLEGRPWEYLGSEVTIDVKTDDETSYQMYTKPIKSTWCVKASDITFPDDYTLQIPDGTTFDLKIMCYVELMSNFLFNSGMNTMPNWNWFKNCNSSKDLLYNNPAYCSGYFVISKIPQYKRNFITDTMCPINGNLNDNDGVQSVSVFQAPHVGAIGEDYVIVANEVRSLGAGKPTEKHTIRVVKKSAYESYLSTGTALLSDEMILNYSDSEDKYLGAVLQVDYNYSDVKYYGIYNTGEVMPVA